MSHFSVRPLQRDRSLITSHRRSMELDLPAASLAAALRGDISDPLELDERTWSLIHGLRSTLDSPARQETAAISGLCVAVDNAIVELIGTEVLKRLFAVAGLEPELVSTCELPDVPVSDRALVSLTTSFDVGRDFLWEDAIRAARAWWAPFHLTPRGAAWGPFIRPDDPPDEHAPQTSGDHGARRRPGPRDLVARLITAAEDPDQARAQFNQPTFEHSELRFRDVLAALTAFAADVEPWFLGRSPRASWHYIVLEGTQRTCHPVLPLPEASDPAADLSTQLGTSAAADDTSGSAPLASHDVLDPLTGLVVGLRPINLDSAFPRGAVYVESQTADMGRVRPWAANIFNAGSAWDDEEAARQGAVGEAIERYCGNVFRREHLRHCSYEDLRRQGEEAVDPHAWALFSERQYNEPGLPFVPLARDLEVSWVPGRSMTTGRPIWVPASLVYVNWNTGDSITEPQVNPAHYPGIAAAPNREAALCNALEEVVERDATMVWWLSGTPLPALEAPRWVLDRTPPGSTVKTTFLSVPNRFSLPVVAAVVDDVRDGLCTVGLACRHTPEQAARKALLEGLGLIESARDMQKPDGGFWTSYVDAGAPDQPIKDIRTDRLYLDDYRADFRDVTDLFCQLQVQLDPRAREMVTSRWTTQDPPGRWSDLPTLPRRSSKNYVDALARGGFEPVCVELTTSDARAAGWTAVRVLVPGLVPNFPTAFPPLGTGRVCEEPHHLGLVDRPLEEEDIFSFPMPYA